MKNVFCSDITSKIKKNWCNILFFLDGYEIAGTVVMLLFLSHLI